MVNLDYIKERLQDLNISEVAPKMGVHPNTLYRILKGQYPSYRTLEKIQKYLEK